MLNTSTSATKKTGEEKQKTLIVCNKRLFCIVPMIKVEAPAEIQIAAKKHIIFPVLFIISFLHLIKEIKAITTIATPAKIIPIFDIMYSDNGTCTI